MSVLIDLFTYGSLMYREVWMQVVGREVSKERAVLKGYLRRRIKKDFYPVIFPGQGEVLGFLYHDVPFGKLAKLDTFEGRYYRRAQVNVKSASGDLVVAYTYVLRSDYYSLIDGDWDPAEFESNGLLRFLEQYEGFGRLDP